VVRKDTPYKSVKELVEFAKRIGKILRYSESNLYRISMSVFQTLTGIEMTVTPFKELFIGHCGALRAHRSLLLDRNHVS
jgi:tripartite-type tricarboxylate transporter receptor subunit TctC